MHVECGRVNDVQLHMKTSTQRDAFPIQEIRESAPSWSAHNPFKRELTTRYDQVRRRKGTTRASGTYTFQRTGRALGRRRHDHTR